MELSNARKYLRQFAPTAPSPLIDRMVLEATQELCMRARVLTGPVPDVTLDGSAEYVIIPPEDTELVEPLAVRSNNKNLTKAPRRKIGGAMLTQVSTAAYFYKAGATRIGIAPLQPTGTLTDIECSFRPTDDATTLDDTLWQEYSMVIRDGALSKLMAIRNKEWTDLGLAQYHLTRFEEAMDIAVEKSVDGNMVGVARTVKYGGL